MTVPEGLEPLAGWTSADPEFRDGVFSARFFWLSCESPIRHLWRTHRIEFYLFDSPFAVVHRYAADIEHRKYQVGDEIAKDEPVIVPLAELPPEQLLRQA